MPVNVWMITFFFTDGTTCVEDGPSDTKLGSLIGYGVGGAVNVDNINEYSIQTQALCKAKALDSERNAFSFRLAENMPCRTFDLKAESNLGNANTSYSDSIIGCTEVGVLVDDGCQLP